MSVEFTPTEWLSRDIPGRTLEEAAAAISQMTEAGSAEWLPHYDLQDGAAIVTVGTRVTLPQWVGYDSACQAEKDEWDRFAAALLAHEQGHIDLVVEHLREVDRQLVPEYHKTAWEQALESLRVASNAYDAQTDHGRSAGTIIDVSVATAGS